MCYCYTKPTVRGNGRPAVRENWRPARTAASDTRYTKKVEDGKSRLSTLILSQAAVQLFSLLNFVPKKGGSLDRVAVSFTVLAFVSILVGELGRRYNRVSLLMCYLAASNLAIMISLGSAGRTKFLIEVIGDTSEWKKNMLQLLTNVPILLGSLLQTLSSGTTITLTAYMYSLKRAS
ncbi:uncharacterized protein LOC131318918 [Rhododendron vialii]|uniref:uncharacterized protein LOC131318918 n=1 Tax=Rhododendron vialii TaxID=182163 RepID=UPI00265FB0FD|nr:uncharacterized protein LOC131318918 [Rhododendron vialii]